MSHAQLRAKERYGLSVTPEDFRLITAQVRSGRAIKLARKGFRTGIYLVTVQDQDVVVVYNRRAKWVLTFLPLDWRSPWMDRSKQ